MSKIYKLHIDPSCKYQPMTLSDPLSGEHADLATIAALMLGGNPGKYLLRVSVEVEVLARQLEPVPFPEPIANGKALVGSEF